MSHLETHKKNPRPTIKSRGLRWVSYILLSLLPAIPPVAVAICQGVSLLQAKPIWSDEAMYWQETISIAANGIGRNGNSGYNETSSLLGFDAHGPFPASLYGAIYHVAGLHSPGWYPIIGIALVCLALMCLLFLVSPSFPTAAAASVIVSCSPYSLIYLPTFMSEAWNIALIVLLIALIYRAWKRPGSLLWFTLTALCVAILVATRITYIFLLVPLVLTPSRLSRGRLVLRNSLAVVFMGLAAIVSRLFTAGYPVGFLASLQAELTQSFVGALRMLLTHAASNTKEFLDPTNGTLIEVSSRYLYLLVITYCCYRGIKILKSERRLRPDREETPRSWPGLLNSHLAVAFVMFATAAAVIVFYDVFSWRDFRVLAPLLMGGMLFLAVSNTKAGLVLAGITILLGLTLYIPSLSSLSVTANSEARLTAPECGDSIASKVTYHPGPVDQWQNTLLIVDSSGFPTQVLRCLPAGIGINYDFDSDAQPEKAGYILSGSPTYIPPESYHLVAQEQGLFLYEDRPA